MLISLIFFSVQIISAQSYSLQFDGDNDYVTANGVCLTLGSSSTLTLECWINTTFGSETYPYFLAFNTSDGGNNIQLGTSSDHELKFYDGVNNHYGSVLESNTWYHVALTVDALNNAIVYLNGTSDIAATTTVRPQATGKFSIAQEWDGSSASGFFKGYIDEVRIWNTARSITQIQTFKDTQLAGTESGLMAYYKMTDGSGTTVTDNSSNLNNGTLYNGTSVANGPTWQADAFTPAGVGSSSSPYQIAGLKNLFWLSKTTNVWGAVYFEQTADIDASATSEWDGGNGFSPIGDYYTTVFTGHYDGKGNAINGLTINRTAANDIGLFGCTFNAVLSNLGVTGLNITGYADVGGLAGFSITSIVSNCNSAGSVSGYENIGGLIGRSVSNAEVSNCYSIASVSGSNSVGGLVGYTYDSATVTNSYANGSVTATGVYSGGLVGFNFSSAQINNCYSTGAVSGNTEVGGLVGKNIRNSSITYCYSIGAVSGVTNTGGLVGENSDYATVYNSFWNVETSNQSSSAGGLPSTTSEMKDIYIYLYSGWDLEVETSNGSNSHWDIDYANVSYNSGYPFLSWQNGAEMFLPLTPTGSGSAETPYQISNAADLFWISLSVLSLDKYFVQTNNINASVTSGWNGGGGFLPIGKFESEFTGSYDGQGFTIDGLTIKRSSIDYVGLFGITKNATIQNLGVTNVDISGDDYSGCLVGSQFYGVMNNCYSTGAVTGTSYVGGLIGYNYYTNVNNCFSTGTVSGYDYLGGLTGNNCFHAEINNCYSRCDVTRSGGSNVRIGGFCGYNSAIIEYCYSTGSVTYESAINPIDKGFVGSDYIGSYVNNLWDSEASNQTTATGATAKTTAQMKTRSTFTSAGWDANTWYMDAGINDGYPYLSWQNPGGSPLPVELVSFSVNVVEDKVVLKWQTETEVNNYGFEIERSPSPTPSQSEGASETPLRGDWGAVGFVQGRGNSNSPKQYSFIDPNPQSGKVQYRLKQIDFDGKFEYSNTFDVNVEIPERFSLAQNFPNPFNPVTTINYQLPKSGSVTLKIFDILGNEVKTLVNEQKEKGRYTVQFDASSLASGMYVYQLRANDYTSTKKMILIK
ncbi:MAG: GLUG motif-containing protein [Ignavibacteria bacterium]|nr:GLUG motif-containing protein [Ignavibacteria bacterium]